VLDAIAHARRSIVLAAADENALAVARVQKKPTAVDARDDGEAAAGALTTAVAALAAASATARPTNHVSERKVLGVVGETFMSFLYLIARRSSLLSVRSWLEGVSRFILRSSTTGT